MEPRSDPIKKDESNTSSEEKPVQTKEENEEISQNNKKDSEFILISNEQDPINVKKDKSFHGLGALWKARFPIFGIFLSLVLFYIFGSFIETDFKLSAYKKGEVYILNCSSFTEISSSYKIGKENENVSGDSLTYSVIILNQTEKTMNFVFFHSNISETYSIETSMFDKSNIHVLFYLIVESDVETGEILTIKYPKHISEHDVILVKPFVKAFLVNKKNAESQNKTSSFEDDLNYHNHFINDSEKGRMLETRIENKDLIFATLSSEGQSIQSFIPGVKGKTTINQYIKKDSKKLERSEIEYDGIINIVSTKDSNNIHSQFNHKITLEVEEIDGIIEPENLDYFMMHVEDQNFSVYSEKKVEYQKFNPETPRNLESNFFYTNLTITDIFGENLNFDMSIYFLGNERCGFKTKMKLSNFFTWELCEGIYGPETSKRLKQVFSLKDSYSSIIDQVDILVSKLTSENLEASKKLLEEIYKNTTDFMEQIRISFKILLDRIHSYKTDYSLSFMKDSKPFVGDMITLNYTEFKNKQKFKIDLFINETNTLVSNFLMKSNDLKMETIEEAFKLNKTVSTFENLKNLTSINDKSHLMNFSYFQLKLEKINYDFNESMQEIEKIKKMAEDYKIMLKIRAEQLRDEFCSDTQSSLNEFANIAKTYNNSLNTAPPMNIAKQQIYEVLNFTNRMEKSLNYHENLPEYLKEASTSINFYGKGASSFLETVNNYIYKNSLEEYSLNCKNKNSIEIFIDVKTEYTIIKTPVTIDIPQEFMLNTKTDTDKVSKDIKNVAIVSIRGGNFIQTPAYQVKDFIHSDIILTILYEIGLSLAQLSFYHILIVSIKLYRNMYVWKKYSYPYYYRDCKTPPFRRCRTKSRIVWTSEIYEKSILEQDKDAGYVRAEGSFNIFI